MFVNPEKDTFCIKLRWRCRCFFCKYPVLIICCVFVLAFIISTSLGEMLFFVGVIFEGDIYDYYRKSLAEIEIGDPNIKFDIFEAEDLLKLILIQRIILRGKIILDVARIREEEDFSFAYYDFKMNRTYLYGKHFDMITPSYYDILKIAFDPLCTPIEETIEERFTTPIIKCLLVSIYSNIYCLENVDLSKIKKWKRTLKGDGFS